MKYQVRLPLVILFAIAMAFVETAVVVYLRALYYPEGFAIILKEIPQRHLEVELCRELATVIMLGTVAMIAGRHRWERFGYFLILFGVWDIFYYVWLKVVLDWPASLFDWDVLFLIPVPWVGPVLAPVLISLTMISTGVAVTWLYARGKHFRARPATWILALLATALILFSFMKDYKLTLSQQMPQPYWYSLLLIGVALYIVAFWLSHRRASQLSQRS